MKRAISKLRYFKGSIIIDGNMDFQLNNFSCKSILKGDQKSITIATASIIAKVHRDRYMAKIGKKFQSYEWAKNAGYGTKKHIAEIYENGVTIHHRKSFEPIKRLIHSYDSNC